MQAYNAVKVFTALTLTKPTNTKPSIKTEYSSEHQYPGKILKSSSHGTFTHGIRTAFAPSYESRNLKSGTVCSSLFKVVASHEISLINICANHELSYNKVRPQGSRDKHFVAVDVVVDSSVLMDFNSIEGMTFLIDSFFSAF